MTRMCTAFIVVAVLGGCGDLATRPAPGPATDAAPAQTRRPAPPPPGATTPEQFDTTTAAQRAEAAAVRPDGARVLGTTIASLGSPTEPGFWLKTPLVTTETPGRVTNPATGKSAAVTLIPIPGPPTAGSRMSLPALRLIGAQLGALTPVEVSVTG